MKISLEWLKELVDVSVPAEELAHRLTMAGLPVDEIIRESERFPKVVVGDVVERIKHPNADALSVCKVNVGAEILEIVCGAPNVAAGQRVAVAVAGALIGDIIIAKRKIRGIVSNGMICSAQELGLQGGHEGIMVLNTDATIGQPFREYLGLTDTIFEIDVTPNRADALSHIGVARDVAALYETHVIRPEVKFAESKVLASDIARVEIQNPDSCPRYCARVVRGVRIGASPEWMQKRLQRVGIRPVNNVVDVTNYVLMECGHPLHAFDFGKIGGKKIVVRNAGEDQTFLTLDGKNRGLRTDTLMICDAEQAVAIAGVMGGQNSEISENTADVFIESAYFNPSSIRRTSKFLGLSSDSSYRFERGTDIENTVYAVNRAAQLIQQLAGGEILSGFIDAYPKKHEPKRISVRTQRIGAVLGATLPLDEMTTICSRLGFNPAKKSEAEFEVAIPSYRPDMESEIDVIEEIARVVGYDRFAPRAPNISVRLPLRSAPMPEDVRGVLRSLLSAHGYCEIVTSSLIDERQANIFSEAIVRVANPISSEMSVLRPSPLPGALATIARNIHHGTRDIRIFEIARTAERTESKDSDVEKRFSEKEWIVVASCGNMLGSWDAKPRSVDFYDVKGEVERVLYETRVHKYKFVEDKSNVFCDPSLSVIQSGRAIGAFGAISRGILKKFDIDVPVYAGMLETSALPSGRAIPHYVAPPRFPGIVRDLAIIAPVEKTGQEIQEAIMKSASSPLLRGIRIFDVFPLDNGTRSVAFSLEFAADDRTLRDEEAADVITKIIKDLEQRHHFSIRS